MLVLPTAVRDEMVAACLDGYPLEVCGLLGGTEDQDATAILASYPAHNAAASSRVYTVEPRDLLRADRAAEDAGWSLVGVWHSHTHTDAYPSPTDIAQAPDPDWHYVLISLRDTEPVVRSYRIRDGETEEEPVVLQ
jgi:proteasome lid subunit RPN8/RPN11